MAVKYDLVLRMVFDNEADRNTWYDTIKTGAVNAKGTHPSFESANMRKQDRYEPEQTSEGI
jgi:hypothetical protein